MDQTDTKYFLQLFSKVKKKTSWQCQEITYPNQKVIFHFPWHLGPWQQWRGLVFFFLFFFVFFWNKSSNSFQDHYNKTYCFQDHHTTTNWAQMPYNHSLPDTALWLTKICSTTSPFDCWTIYIEHTLKIMSFVSSNLIQMSPYCLKCNSWTFHFFPAVSGSIYKLFSHYNTICKQSFINNHFKTIPSHYF